MKRTREGREAGEHFSGRLERACEPVASCGNDYEDGIPAREISGGDAGAGVDGKRAKRIHSLDGCGRNGVQADCRADRAEGRFLEETGGKGGSRRAHWTGTIRVAGGRMGPERGRDPGEGGGECGRRFKRAGAVARETRGS